MSRRDAVPDDLRRPRPGRDYYAFTLEADPDGTQYMTCQTEWAGPHPERNGWELRVPRLVNPAAHDLVHGPGGYLVVEGPDQLDVWFGHGGAALVEAETAREHLEEHFEPAPSVHDPLGGYRDPAVLPPQALSQHPTAKLRMAVLKRDDCRCRICGRDADDALDLRLHVHHVRPVSIGGLTELQNLITLCQTCHEGLDPHYEPRLIAKAAPPPVPDSAGQRERFERYLDARHGGS